MRGTWWFGLLLIAIVALGGTASASVPWSLGDVGLMGPAAPVDAARAPGPPEPPERLTNATTTAEPLLDDGRAALDAARLPQVALSAPATDGASLASPDDSPEGTQSTAGSDDATAAEPAHEPSSESAEDEPSSDPAGEGETPEDCDPAAPLRGLVPEPPTLPLPAAPTPWLPDPAVVSPLGPVDVAPPADVMGPPAGPAPSEPARPTTEAVAPADAPRQLVPPAALAFAGVALAVAAAGGTAATGHGAAVLRPLSWLRHALWLPLYARVAKDQVLDHETRQELLDRLRAAPGACIAELQAASGASLNTIRHHLRVLQANGVVTSVKNGRRRCFFPVEVGWSAESRTAAAAVSARAPRRVFRLIEARPGIKQQELAAVLGVTPTSIAFHARRLQDAGVVRAERAGRAMVYYPAAQPA